MASSQARSCNPDHAPFGWNFFNPYNNNNNNQYIYKQRQSHAMSQRRWLATAVIFRPSDMSLGFALGVVLDVVEPLTCQT